VASQLRTSPPDRNLRSHSSVASIHTAFWSRLTPLTFTSALQRAQASVVHIPQA
jgi:hypothetical protein